MYHPIGHHAIAGRHLHHHREGCSCGCSRFNWYRWPAPERKRNRILDTTGLRIHTDKFVGETCFDRGPCCEPVPVKISEEIKSFIIRAATDCLEPSTYYTLYIDHALCDEIWCKPTFIQVEKCGLFQDPVKLVYTETVFPMCEFDGRPKCGIPADPAFPDQDLIHIHREEDFRENGGPLVTPSFAHAFGRRDDSVERRLDTRLIPVELDLHGQTAFGDNFVKHGGPHPKQPLVLFYTNRGTFSLTRNWWRKTDY